MKKIVALSAFAALTVSGAAAFAASPATTPSLPEGRSGSLEMDAEHTKMVINGMSLSDAEHAYAEAGCTASSEGTGEFTYNEGNGFKKATAKKSHKYVADCRDLKKAIDAKKKGHKGGKLAHTGSPAVAASLASLLAVVTGAGVVAYRKFA